MSRPRPLASGERRFFAASGREINEEEPALSTVRLESRSPRYSVSVEEPQRRWWWSDEFYAKSSPAFSRFLARRPIAYSALLGLFVTLVIGATNPFVWWKDGLAFIVTFAIFYGVGATNRGFINRGGKYRDGSGWSYEDR